MGTRCTLHSHGVQGPHATATRRSACTIVAWASPALTLQHGARKLEVLLGGKGHRLGRVAGRLAQDLRVASQLWGRGQPGSGQACKRPGAGGAFAQAAYRGANPAPNRSVTCKLFGACKGWPRTWMPMRPVPSLGESAGVMGITSCSPARCTVSCSSRPGLSLPGGEQRCKEWCPCQRSHGLQAVSPRGALSKRGHCLQTPHPPAANPPQHSRPTAAVQAHLILDTTSCTEEGEGATSRSPTRSSTSPCRRPASAATVAALISPSRTPGR